MALPPGVLPVEGGTLPPGVLPPGDAPEKLPMESAHGANAPGADDAAAMRKATMGPLRGRAGSFLPETQLESIVPMAATAGYAAGGPPGSGLAAGAGRGAEDFLRHALGLPTPEFEPGAMLGTAAANSIIPQAFDSGGAWLASKAPGLMEQALRGYQAIEAKFPSVSVIREALRRGAQVVRGDVTEPLASRASSSNAAREAMFDSAKRADQLLEGADAATVPKTTVSLTPKKLADTTPIQQTAGTFLGEVQAHTAIHDAAEAAGVDPDMLMGVLRTPNPDIQQIADLYKHGLDAKALDRLRGLVPLLDRADEARAAMQTIFQPSSKTVNVPALRYSADDVTAGVHTLLAKLRRSSTGASPDVQEIEGYLNQFLADHPGMLKPTEVDAIRQFAGTAAKSAIAARQAGGSAAASVGPNWGIFNDAIQGTVRRRLATDVAGLAAQNANTQQLMALSKALANAEKSIGPPVTKGLESLRWNLGASPEGLSRLALILNNPQTAQMLSGAGRGLGIGAGEVLQQYEK